MWRSEIPKSCCHFDRRPVPSVRYRNAVSRVSIEYFSHNTMSPMNYITRPIFSSTICLMLTSEINVFLIYLSVSFVRLHKVFLSSKFIATDMLFIIKYIISVALPRYRVNNTRLLILLLGTDM